MMLLFHKLVSASAEYRLRLKYAPPSATIEQEKTLRVYFWGLSRSTLTIDNCGGNGLSTVTIRKTFLQFIIGIITLGIVAPLTVAWECAKDNCNCDASTQN